jgi:hypothetical protein
MGGVVNGGGGGGGVDVTILFIVQCSSTYNPSCKYKCRCIHEAQWGCILYIVAYI